MQQIKQVLIATLIITVTVSFILPNDWYLFKSTNISVEFPARPATKTSSIKLKAGTVTTETSSFEDNSSSITYILTVTEYPDSMMHSGSAAKLPNAFKYSVDESLKQLQGKLLSEKIIEINGFPGSEARIEYENGGSILKQRTYFIKNKRVLQQTLSKTRHENNPDVLKFHNSLKMEK